MVKKILSLLGWLQPQSLSKSIEKVNRKDVTVQDALKMALTAKLQSDSERTCSTFSAQAKMFKYFIVIEKLHIMSIRAFGKREAVMYLDHLSESRTLSNTSWNNYLTQIKSLFGELLKRELIDENHFSAIELKMEKQTKRRPFTFHEAQIIGEYLRQHKPILFIAIIL